MPIPLNQQIIIVMFIYNNMGFQLKRFYIHLFIIGLACSLISCSKHPKEKGTPEYISEINSWHKHRIENLKKENGWLNLTGLFWLKPGENKFGTDNRNDVIFPEGKAPDFIGKFTLLDSIVTIKINKNINVTCNCKTISALQLVNDNNANPTILSYGSLRWFIIKRNNRYGVRLRDLESPLLKSFGDIDKFPINSDWKVEAKLEPYKPQKKILVPSIIGEVDTAAVAAALVFEINGTKYRLDPISEENGFFIIFADETSGKETYGACRFISVDKPDSMGKVYIDFNKAYNPPCAFTKYATCPLPPRQNYLKIEITAGEKMFHSEQHAK
jgi:uncharacterized protein